MSDSPSAHPLPPAEALSVYRDALLRDAPAAELARLADALEPDEVTWLELFRAVQREPVAIDPAFRARLERVVATAPGFRPGSGRPRLGRSHGVTPRRSSAAVVTAPSARPWFHPRRAAPHLATTALLVVLLVAGLYAVGLLRPRPEEQILGAVGGPVQLEFLWDSRGGADPISQAYGVGVDPQGNVWVSDARDRFHIVASDGTFLEVWGAEGSGEGQFEFTSSDASVYRGYGDVAFAPDGTFYVADTGNSRIQRFAPDRAFLTSWGSKGTGDGQFLAPSGIAIGPDGTIYVSDEGRDDIQRFDGDGRFLDTIGAAGQEPGFFNTPAGLAVARTGDVYVADYGNRRIQRFTATGELVAAWGSAGSAPGQFNNPNDVAVDASGQVYVADDFNNRMQVFSADGRFLATIGSFGDDPGQLNDPLGVAAGPDGIAYVSDRTSLQAFRLVPVADGAGATRDAVSTVKTNGQVGCHPGCDRGQRGEDHPGAASG